MWCHQHKTECISEFCFTDNDQCRLDEIADEEEARELEAHDSCGRWDNGSLRRSCLRAGTEFCDWDCPHNRPVERKPKPIPLFEGPDQ